MTNDAESEINKSEKNNRIRIWIEMTPENAERFEKAFAEGKFIDLGITNLQRVEPEVNATNPEVQKKWGDSEKDRRSNPGEDKVPPLPK